MHKATLLKFQGFFLSVLLGFSWSLSFSFAGNLRSTCDCKCESIQNPLNMKDLLLKLRFHLVRCMVLLFSTNKMSCVFL